MLSFAVAGLRLALQPWDKSKPRSGVADGVLQASLLALAAIAFDGEESGQKPSSTTEEVIGMFLYNL